MKKQVKTNYKVGGIVLLIAMLAIIFPTVSKANLQSRPGATSLKNKTESEFFLLCRQMETSDGPMGLNAEISTENDTVTETTSSNRIDVHMIKNTEYGTAAMLETSAYGETAGNDSGIKQMYGGYLEFVAGIYDKLESENTYIYNADAKYKNVYKSSNESTAYIPGDATYETKGWKGARYSNFVYSSQPNFSRSYYGLFDYLNIGYDGWSCKYTSSRAALVCGEGF